MRITAGQRPSSQRPASDAGSHRGTRMCRTDSQRPSRHVPKGRTLAECASRCHSRGSEVEGVEGVTSCLLRRLRPGRAPHPQGSTPPPGVPPVTPELLVTLSRALAGLSGTKLWAAGLAPERGGIRSLRNPQLGVPSSPGNPPPAHHVCPPGGSRATERPRISLSSPSRAASDG
jgi:hypothetical protein